MSFQAYITRKFTPKSMALIDKANEIIREYEAQGFSLTLRQLYYQFVARDLIANKQTEYKRLGSVINDARLAGFIDWTAIEDRTRNLNKLGTWDSPQDILESAANSFRMDLWESQPCYVEVWVEKEALTGVIAPTCEKWRVPYFACRGYTSQSEQWGAGQRFVRNINDGKIVHVFHLGDHDPSGLDMTRDNHDRLYNFIAHESDEGSFNLHRLALNMDQIKKYKPPRNPAKETDSRHAGYSHKYGTDSSWELDALEPKVIAKLISDHIVQVIDIQAWDTAQAKEEKYKDRLHKLADKFGE